MQINCSQGNFTAESEAARRKFELQATEKMASVKLVLPRMSKDYRKCDPTKQKEGETYVQVLKQAPKEIII